jgi:hypothetical protein
MLVIDNTLSTQVFKSLKEQIFDGSFPWYFTHTSNFISTQTLSDFSFSHTPFMEDKILSNVGFECRSALLTISDKLNFKIKKIIRIRIGLLEPKPEGKYVNDPHVDNIEQHFAGLLYLNDSDGETVIYNEKYDIQYNMNPVDHYNNVLKRKVSIKQKVECKENRFVMFDGFHYHSSTCPTNVNRRIVINFNFEIE